MTITIINLSKMNYRFIINLKIQEINGSDKNICSEKLL